MPSRKQLRHPDRHPQEGVVVAYIHPGKVHGVFMSSFLDTIRWDRNNRDHIYGPNGGGTIELESGPRLSEARCQVVEAFLKDFPRATWLFMIDSDMAWKPEAFDTVLSACSEERPIVGGLCFAGGRSKMVPTIYSLQPGEHGPEPHPVNDFPEDTLVKADATGTAFLCVHRKVFLAMARDWPEGFGTTADGSKNPHPWFVEGLHAGRQWGEDMAFCMRANALGFPLHVHTGAEVDHLKSFRLNLETWHEYQDGPVREAGFLR